MKTATALFMRNSGANNDYVMIWKKTRENGKREKIRMRDGFKRGSSSLYSSSVAAHSHPKVRLRSLRVLHPLTEAG